VEFPRCFRTLVVKIEKTNSNSTRDFSKSINFTRVDLFVWSTLVVKIKKRRNPLHILGEHNFTTVVSPGVCQKKRRRFEFRTKSETSLNKSIRNYGLQQTSKLQ